MWPTTEIRMAISVRPPNTSYTVTGWHAPYRSWRATLASPAGSHAIVPLLALGLYIGLVYERTGRLGVPIAMHAAFNAGNIAMAFWAAAETS